MPQPAVSPAEDRTVLRESAADLGPRAPGRRAPRRSPRLAAFADALVVSLGLMVIFGVVLAAARLLNP